VWRVCVGVVIVKVKYAPRGGHTLAHLFLEKPVQNVAASTRLIPACGYNKYCFCRFAKGVCSKIFCNVFHSGFAHWVATGFAKVVTRWSRTLTRPLFKPSFHNIIYVVSKIIFTTAYMQPMLTRNEWDIKLVVTPCIYNVFQDPIR